MATVTTNLLEDAFPTVFVAARLSDPDDDSTYGALDTKADLATFFRANSAFELRITRLVDYLNQPGSTLEGLQDADILKSTVDAIQRLYVVAPRYAQMRPLVADGVSSSLQISKMGRVAFSLRYAEALQVFERTRKTNAAASSLLMNFGFAGSEVFPAGIWKGLWSSLDVDWTITDFATLFGGLDMCVCDGCSGLTVDSPAAYYVDILHFLRDRGIIELINRKDGKISKVDGKVVIKNAKDIIFVRRPDLGEIELNCPNTNTPVPYVDLCIEILEETVTLQSKFDSFSLPATVIEDLDAAQIGDWRSLFTPPLTEYATVTVMKAGGSWAIDELKFSYDL